MADAPALELPAVTDPERLVMSRGNLFSVTTTRGDIAPAGARELGVFHQDTRHLSYYELILPGGAPTLLTADVHSASLTQIDLTASELQLGELVDEPVNFLHVRRTQLLDEDDLVDQLLITNYLGHAVDLPIELRFAADFADVFEVRGARRLRRGRLLPPVVGDDAVELGYEGLDGEHYRTALRFTPAPASLGPAAAVYALHLDPGETQLLEVAVTPSRGAIAPAALHRPLDLRVGALRAAIRRFQGRATRIECDNRLVQAALDRGLDDVASLRIQHDGAWIVGAGIPWYAAPFGRDSIIASAQLLGFAPDLAVETLRFLARHQGTAHDPMREEEPGKIMHELRRGEMARVGEVPHTPYFGTVDATPLYVILAGETWRWLGDRALLEELWPHVVAAMGWVEAHTAGGTRLVTYQRTNPRGLLNQGWKDSRDGVSFPDGRRALPPIALVEVQGYVAAAYRHGAALAAARGEAELAARWGARVEPTVRRIDEAFWVEESGYHALALDGAGRRVPTITSNPGHLLWCGAALPTRVPRIAEVLLGPELYSGWGIRTAGRGQTVYNPMSYHNGSVWPHDNAIAALGLARHGLTVAAMRVLDGMFAASQQLRHHRLPELFCGMARGEREFLVQYPVSCSPQAWAAGALFMLLQASLGLDPDAACGRLRIHDPHLPERVRRLELHHVRVGSATVSLRFARAGARTHADVLDVTGGPLRVEIHIG